MGEITFTVTITDTDEKLLKDDILDIQEWIDKAVAGKVNRCWGRFQKEWTSKLIDDPTIESIPATKEGMVATVIVRGDYKDKLAKYNEQDEILKPI